MRELHIAVFDYRCRRDPHSSTRQAAPAAPAAKTANQNRLQRSPVACVADRVVAQIAERASRDRVRCHVTNLVTNHHHHRFAPPALAPPNARPPHHDAHGRLLHAGALQMTCHVSKWTAARNRAPQHDPPGHHREQHPAPGDDSPFLRPYRIGRARARVVPLARRCQLLQTSTRTTATRSQMTISRARRPVASATRCVTVLDLYITS